MSYAKLIIVGNLGRDPEMRYTSGGDAVTNLNVAVTRKWTSKDGVPGEETTWYRATCWRRTAEIAAQYLHKGSQVMLEGRLNPDANGGPRLYEKSDGTSGASFELTVERLVLLSSRSDNSFSDVPADPGEDVAPDEFA